MHHGQAFFSCKVQLLGKVYGAEKAVGVKAGPPVFGKLDLALIVPFVGKGNMVVADVQDPERCRCACGNMGSEEFHRSVSLRIYCAQYHYTTNIIGMRLIFG